MTTIVYGERLARQASVVVVCSAAVFDAERRLLLTRRADNNLWCLPGGHLEAGESVAEAVVREVKEETGLDVEVIRLAGVYSNPHRVLQYTSGRRVHVVALNFEVRVVGGDLSLSDETCDFRWCHAPDILALDLVDSHVERIEDALGGDRAAHVR